MTEFTIPEISEVTILRAENARLKMLLGYVIDVADELKNGEPSVVDLNAPLMSEAIRYASGDSGLKEILTTMVLRAIDTERRRCYRAVTSNQFRCGWHNHEDRRIGHYDNKMLKDISGGKTFSEIELKYSGYPESSELTDAARDSEQSSSEEIAAIPKSDPLVLNTIAPVVDGVNLADHRKIVKNNHLTDCDSSDI